MDKEKIITAIMQDCSTIKDAFDSAIRRLEESYKTKISYSFTEAGELSFGINYDSVGISEI